MITFDVIKSKLTESLFKDNVTLEQLYTRLSESTKIGLEELKKIFSEGKATEEQLKSIAEALKIQEQQPPAQPPTGGAGGGVTSSPLKEALAKTFDANKIPQKVSELMTIINKNDNAQTKTWITEVAKTILEIVDMHTENNPHVAKLHEALKEVSSKLEEQITKVASADKSISELKLKLQESEGLNKSLKETVSKLQTGKGLVEQHSGAVQEQKTGDSRKFSDLSLKDIMSTR